LAATAFVPVRLPAFSEVGAGARAPAKPKRNMVTSKKMRKKLLFFPKKKPFFRFLGLFSLSDKYPMQVFLPIIKKKKKLRFD